MTSDADALSPRVGSRTVRMTVPSGAAFGTPSVPCSGRSLESGGRVVVSAPLAMPPSLRTIGRPPPRAALGRLIVNVAVPPWEICVSANEMLSPDPAGVVGPVDFDEPHPLANADSARTQGTRNRIYIRP